MSHGIQFVAGGCTLRERQEQARFICEITGGDPLRGTRDDRYSGKTSQMFGVTQHFLPLPLCLILCGCEHTLYKYSNTIKSLYVN